MSIKNAIAGAFLRSWIQKQLGKDWYDSWTVWGLIIYHAAEGAVGAVCGDELMMSAVFCAKATAALKTVGGVLTVLGIRRAARREA